MRRFLLIIVVASFALTACHKSEPAPVHDGADSERLDPDSPDTPDDPDNPGDRPGGSDPIDSYDFTPELTDNVFRYTSANVSLRHDTPGVLVKWTDNGAEFYDLDGNSRALVSWTAWGLNDHKGHDVSLEVNGNRVEIASAERVVEVGNVMWIHLIDVSGAHHVVVVPNRNY